MSDQAQKETFPNLREVEPGLYEVIEGDVEDFYAQGLPPIGEDRLWITEIAQIGFAAVMRFRLVEKKLFQDMFKGYADNVRK